MGSRRKKIRSSILEAVYGQMSSVSQKWRHGWSFPELILSNGYITRLRVELKHMNQINQPQWANAIDLEGVHYALKTCPFRKKNQTN